MDERNHEHVDKMDEVMLPGFRFHPTDEELVGFYLKRKIQQRPLSIELIKQLDIYKYDPWDLPKLATTGEKEWYFYCPRDRKYRNSARPNRVTGAGFWKATGTDRPIYSSEGNKCIGLKKSLVFYKGRAAKGLKTDWMMHEFRLPSLTDHSAPPKRFMDKTIIPANDSWAICRIFKKTNSTTQRAISQSWVSHHPPLPELSASSVSASSLLPKGSQDMLTSSDQTCFNYNYNDITNFSRLDFNSSSCYKLPISSGDSNNFFFSPVESTIIAPSRCTVDVSSLLLNMSSSVLGDSTCIDLAGYQEDRHCYNSNNNSFSLSCLPQVMDNGSPSGGGGDENINNMTSFKHVNMDDQWQTVRSTIGFPSSLGDAWKPNLLWDSSSSSDISTSCASAKCYT